VTGWPYCLAEVAIYSVLAGLVIAMALDARDRWRQRRERADTGERDDAEHDQDDAEPPAS